jgi:hypothetical protein
MIAVSSSTKERTQPEDFHNFQEMLDFRPASTTSFMILRNRAERHSSKVVGSGVRENA